jgi:hypothetical protein
VSSATTQWPPSCALTTPSSINTWVCNGMDFHPVTPAQAGGPEMAGSAT